MEIGGRRYAPLWFTTWTDWFISIRSLSYVLVMSFLPSFHIFGPFQKVERHKIIFLIHFQFSSQHSWKFQGLRLFLQPFKMKHPVPVHDLLTVVDSWLIRVNTFMSLLYMLTRRRAPVPSLEIHTEESKQPALLSFSQTDRQAGRRIPKSSLLNFLAMSSTHTTYFQNAFGCHRTAKRNYI